MHVNWKALDAIGLAGGILLLWDDRFIFVMNSWSGEFSVSMVVEDLVRNCKWMATSVNGPSNYQRREDMFKELNDVRGRWKGPWCTGDWNIIRFPSKMLGGSLITSEMRRFQIG